MWSPKGRLPDRQESLVAWNPSALLFVACISLFAPLLARAQSQGQAEVALQGYYLTGNSQPLTDTSGVAARFEMIIPGLGFLSGSVEGYGSQSHVRTGENFVELRG